MAIPRPSSPRAALADLKAFLSGDQRHKLLIGVVSVLMPVIIIIGFITDAHTNILPKGKKITYVESWPADRTDAEIIAQQKIDQKKRDAEREKKRQEYQRVADQLGIK